MLALLLLLDVRDPELGAALSVAGFVPAHAFRGGCQGWVGGGRRASCAPGRYNLIGPGPS